MALEEKTYLICNYTTSPVAISLRDRSFIIEAGSDDNPTTYPLTLSEIQHINNTSTLFKIGCLRPTAEDEEFIYSNLRITDWKDILTNKDIEDIILSPTAEKLTKIIQIKNSLYFERVYGVYIGLKNADAPITANVVKVISARYQELLDNKRDTEITIQEKSSSKDVEATEIEKLKERLEMMEKMLSMSKEASDKKTHTEDTVITKNLTDTPPKPNRRYSKSSESIKKKIVNKTSPANEISNTIDAEFSRKNTETE